MNRLRHLIHRRISGDPTFECVALSVARNPCATVRPIRDTGKVEKGTFLPQQISQLVEHAEGDWKGLILAGYFTGGRLSDLARLKWSNVDLTEKSITFIQRKVEGKTSKARLKIPIHPVLEEYLLSGPISFLVYLLARFREP